MPSSARAHGVATGADDSVLWDLADESFDFIDGDSGFAPYPSSSLVGTGGGAVAGVGPAMVGGAGERDGGRGSGGGGRGRPVVLRSKVSLLPAPAPAPATPNTAPALAPATALIPTIIGENPVHAPATAPSPPPVRFEEGKGGWDGLDSSDGAVGESEGEEEEEEAWIRALQEASPLLR